MSLREKQKIKTRQHIQSVAKKLISEHGFEKTTMRMLSKSAGVGLGTIALHFKDKKSLLLASFYEEIGEVAMKALTGINEGASLREQIRHVIHTMYGYYASYTQYSKTVVKEALFAEGEWGARMEAQTREYIARFSVVFRRAGERGEIRSEIDPLTCTVMLWSVYLNGLIDGLKKDAFDPNEQLSIIMPQIDLLLEGIACSND